MAGPVGMALGPFAFEALGFGFTGTTRAINTQWADVPVAQTLNQQQWTGPTSEDFTIRGVLFAQEFGGQESLDGLIAAANSGEVLMFVSGDAAEGFVHGQFTIQGVEEEKSFHDLRGQARRNAYSIKLRRYGEADGIRLGQAVW